MELRILSDYRDTISHLINIAGINEKAVHPIDHRTLAAVYRIRHHRGQPTCQRLERCLREAFGE
ncbi:MAG: hypothetical protein BGN98_00800 [Microbacterium sp. 69-7]|nr:MAG: hypothetical protein BGN98_00800 [Microbacterium sp. 69-7]